MATAVHHVQVFTRESDVVVTYLESTLKLIRRADFALPRPEVADLLQLTDTEGKIRSTLLGSGNHGLVEVIECPEALSGNRQPRAGGSQLAFSVSDVADCVEQARRLGAIHIIGPKMLPALGGQVHIAAFELAGVRFQLSQNLHASDRAPLNSLAQRVNGIPSEGDISG